MNTVIRLVGVIAALATVAAILAYPFVADSLKPRVLYMGFCALTLTVAMLALMAARMFELLLRHARQMEQRFRKERGEGGASPGSE